MLVKTERLQIVPLGLKYLQSTHAYSSDIENTRLMVYLPNADINETVRFLENVESEWKKERPGFYEFAILKDEEHIGAVSIYIIDEDYTVGEIGWIISKEHWGKGYATEAARAMIDFARNELKLKRIIAHCDSENVASYKVMEKLGMSFISKTGGRRNRSSDEERQELLYQLEL